MSSDKRRPDPKLKRASSVVLVARRNPKDKKSKKKGGRHDPSSIRVLMVKRAARTSHMGNLLVFPGGSVDENDFPIPLSQFNLKNGSSSSSSSNRSSTTTSDTDTIKTENDNHMSQLVKFIQDNNNTQPLEQSQSVANYPSLRLLTAGHRTIPEWEGLHNSSMLFQHYDHQHLLTISSQIETPRQSLLDLSVSYAHRATALREIFEESGLVGIPYSGHIDTKFTPPRASSASKKDLISQNLNINTTTNHHHDQPIVSTIAPAFLPIDVDKYYSGLQPESVAKENITALTPLSSTLGISLHETFRRIIHLNNQCMLDDLYQEMNPNRNATRSPDSTAPLPPATFIDYCETIGILTNPITHDKASENPIRHLPHTQMDGELSVFDTLVPIAKWISPIVEPKRFDTNFYMTLVETDAITFSPKRHSTDGAVGDNGIKLLDSAAGTDDPLDDILDDMMCHFQSVAQVQNQTTGLTYRKPKKDPEEAKLSPIERKQSQLEQLASSTLSQEISNIEWVTPIDVLSRLDEVTMAPPTQYILSQLAGFGGTVDGAKGTSDIEQFLANPNLSPHTNNYYQQHVPFCPHRSSSVSFDPYTVHVVGLMDQLCADGRKVGKNANVDFAAGGHLPKFQNSYFPSPQQSFFNQKLPDGTPRRIPSKGQVLLPQDFMHPLTQQLLNRALDILTTTPTEKILTTDQYSDYQSSSYISSDSEQQQIDIYHEFGQSGGNLDPKWTKSLTFPQISSIILGQMSPPLKLSAVDLYQAPLELIAQYGELALDSGVMDNSVVKRVLESTPIVQDSMKPLIHFHRIVDAVVHNNWEIVISNPKTIFKTWEELDRGNTDAKM